MNDLPALPPVVRWAIEDPDPGTTGWTRAAGFRWAWRAWGPETAPPVLLLHGVGSSSATFWRLGPALGAVGRRVVAIDQAGHGRTGRWLGHHRFRDNAADVAAFVEASGLAGPGPASAATGASRQPEGGSLVVIGHSWGAMTAAALPAAGLRPDRIVLLDPPAAPLATMQAMADDPGEAPYPDLAAARAAVQAANPDWDERDVVGKAEALQAMDPAAVRSVLVDNGDWDGGLSDLADAAAVGIPVRVIRGEPVHGGLTPDAYLTALRRTVAGARSVTIAGAGHSPLRDDPPMTIRAVLAVLAA
jgi:pimeloyl-ACP methyl ester carboxylesterase